MPLMLFRNPLDLPVFSCVDNMMTPHHHKEYHTKSKHPCLHSEQEMPNSHSFHAYLATQNHITQIYLFFWLPFHILNMTWYEDITFLLDLVLRCLEFFNKAKFTSPKRGNSRSPLNEINRLVLTSDFISRPSAKPRSREPCSSHCLAVSPSEAEPGKTKPKVAMAEPLPAPFIVSRV